MINLNSPTVQSMLANTPSGGLGNMPMCYGNPPTVETVQIPSPQHVQISPYPDPYNMITGAGLANYMPMPSFNFTGAIGGPSMMPNNVPMYTDMTQPITGGVINNLPINGYSNPYMSFTGSMYGSSLPGYTLKQERYYKYLYASPEDRYAMDMGFDSMAELKSNEISILSKLSIMAHTALGDSEEVIEDIRTRAEKEIDRLEREDRTKSNTNPFNNFLDPNLYRSNDEQVVIIHAKIVKDEKVICEVGGKNQRSFYPSRFNSDDIERRVRDGLRMIDAIKLHNIEKYNRAPERQVDNLGVIDFFNKGFGIIHYYDRLENLKSTQNVTKLFDSKEFKRKLQMEYGPPEAKRRIYREDLRNFRGPKQEEEDFKNGLIRGGYGYMPGGIPLSPGVDPNIGSAISFDLNTGGLRISLPPELDDLPVTDKYSKQAMTARDRFIRSIDR